MTAYAAPVIGARWVEAVRACDQCRTLDTDLPISCELHERALLTVLAHEAARQDAYARAGMRPGTEGRSWPTT